MEIRISKAAAKSLRKSNKREILTRKILELASSPSQLSANILRLTGKREYRLRVQDWRIIFRIEDNTLFVDEIEPRGSVYEDRS